MPIYKWNQDKDKILARIQSSATLKLCVKVLDEPSLIEGWIRHHEQIVGADNLIIADNGSTDLRSLEIYQRYGDRVTIFQFDGPHNDIHWHPRFLDLFNTLTGACRYFSFIDADERLIWLNSTSWVADSSIVEKLRTSNADDIIPSTWLINVLNETEVFSLLDTEYSPKFQNNLRWGKPILPARLIGVQSGIHNVQFDRFVFSKEFGVHFFLLHYTQFPARRIAVNRNKLISRGIVSKNATIDEIMEMNLHNHPDRSVNRFVQEIRAMINIEVDDLEFRKQSSSLVRLSDDGCVYYSDDQACKTLSGFLGDGPELIGQFFGGAKPDEAQFNDPNSLLAFAKELRSRGEGASAEWLFKRGMALYPDFLDQYGGPAFRKELMRSLLARKEWAGAKELVPSSERDPGGIYWHRILFARAYSQVGDGQTAMTWWKLVLEYDPGNNEARSYLSASPPG